MRMEWILRRQSGVISRDQALAAGMSARQVDGRLAAGQWVILHPRVYFVADRELTDDARVRAAALWAGKSATISGLAAAWWHGLEPDAPPVVDVTVPPSRRPRACRGVRVRRREIADVDRVGVRDLWVTDLPLTVLEVTVALGERGPTFLDHALQRRVRFDSLLRAQSRNLGRHGARAAGRLLVTAADRAASAAERILITLLRRAHLTCWQLHYRVRGYELDAAFPAHRVAVEVDGWAWHQDRRTFQNDRQRQNTIVLAGWTLLRFTWHDLTHRPDSIIAEIRAALTAQAAS